MERLKKYYQTKFVAFFECRFITPTLARILLLIQTIQISSIVLAETRIRESPGETLIGSIRFSLIYPWFGNDYQSAMLVILILQSFPILLLALSFLSGETPSILEDLLGLA